MIVPFGVEIERLAARYPPQAGVWLRQGALEVVGDYWAAQVSVLDTDGDVEGPIEPDALRLARDSESPLQATNDTLRIPGRATFERDPLAWVRRCGYQELREQLLAQLPQPTRFTIDTRALVELAGALDAHQGLVEIELRAPHAALVIRPIIREGYYDDSDHDGQPDPRCEALLMPSPQSAERDPHPTLSTENAENRTEIASGWRAEIEATLARLLQGSCDPPAIERWLNRPRPELSDQSPKQLLDQATDPNDPRVQAVLELAPTTPSPHRTPLTTGQARQLANRSAQLADTLATTGGLTPDSLTQAAAIARDAATLDWQSQPCSHHPLDPQDTLTTLNQAIDTNASADIQTALRQLTTIADRHADTPPGDHTNAC